MHRIISGSSCFESLLITQLPLAVHVLNHWLQFKVLLVVVHREETILITQPLIIEMGRMI
jgi:hypothetical protein